MIRFSRYFLTAALLGAVIAFAAEPTVPDKSQEAKYREVAQQIKLFGDIYKSVSARYVDEIAPTDFIKAGIDGMLGTLDPYTVFIEPDETSQLDEITQGKYGGVGIEIGLRGKNRELTVISPIEDTPAARKGLRAGDVIIAVEGKSTAGFTTQDATKLIRGPEGTSVTLTIRRLGVEEPLDYTLERQEIRIHDVNFAGMVTKDVALIKLAHFSSLAGSELDSALAEVLKYDPKGLILDLRSNPGGLLPSAISVAQEFLNTGDPIVSTKGRSSGSDHLFQAGGKPRVPDLPLVVLVNGGSASASEIVSGAIQDLDRGVIVGTQSFGKGLVQSVMNLSDGAVLKMTTARYYTPSGRLIQRDRPKQGELALETEDGELDPETGEIIRRETTPQDTVREKFSTRAGRDVFGGGGITPDIIVEQPILGMVEIEMFRRDLFFGFVSNWLATHPRPDTVEVTPAMLKAFDHYMDSAKFQPPVPGNDALTALRKIGEKDSMNAAFFAQLEDLKKSLAATVSANTPEVRDFIKQSLDRELASALGGRDWRIRSTFDEDVQLQKAIEVLRDRNSYSALLTVATPKTKGKSN